MLFLMLNLIHLWPQLFQYVAKEWSDNSEHFQEILFLKHIWRVIFKLNGNNNFQSNIILKLLY